MVEGVGEYPQPTSERAYMANVGLIDAVLPTNGGALQRDGMWVEEPERFNSTFAQSLPAIARRAGQRYVPSARMEPTDDSRAFLDQPEIWEQAADNLVTIALETRFDSPWDGIAYDFDTFFDEYNDKHEAFLAVLSGVVRNAGLSFEIPFHAVTPETEQTQISLEVVGDVADVVDYYIFIWHESPWPVSPWWWAIESIENALQHIPRERCSLGLANFSIHCPDSGVAETHLCCYDQAIQMVDDARANIVWVDEHETGLIREKYADLGEGHIWIGDGDTMRPRLGLVDQYGLAGAMLFCPGMGTESVWRTIADWKQPRRIERHQRHGLSSRIKSQGGYLVGTDRR